MEVRIFVSFLSVERRPLVKRSTENIIKMLHCWCVCVCVTTVAATVSLTALLNRWQFKCNVHNLRAISNTDTSSFLSLKKYIYTHTQTFSHQGNARQLLLPRPLIFFILLYPRRRSKCHPNGPRVVGRLIMMCWHVKLKRIFTMIINHLVVVLWVRRPAINMPVIDILLLLLLLSYVQ